MIRRHAAFTLLVGALFLALSTAARCQIVYDNGGPNQQNGNEMTQWIQAEDFVLTDPTVITDVHFWSVEQRTSYQGSIVWTFYADGAGQPGAQIARGEVAPLRAATGNTLFFGDEFTNDFNIPALNLGPGTYWLGLHNGPLTTDARAEFYWETTNANQTVRGNEDVTPFDAGGWFNNGQEHAFYLTGNTAVVPEPGAMALLAGLGAGLLTLVRRKRA